MIILAHRGLWPTKIEQNTVVSLVAACRIGAGVELDVRDRAGEVVIAHDPASPAAPRFEDFLQAYRDAGSQECLAINVKADGLQAPLAALLERYQVTNYFVFDMSLPEAVRYRRAKIRFFARVSDYEPVPQSPGGEAGLWVDGFESDWTDWNRLTVFLDHRLELALVSPELHKRDHAAYWSRLREWLSGLPSERKAHVLLCTDHPQAAREFFHG